MDKLNQITNKELRSTFNNKNFVKKTFLRSQLNHLETVRITDLYTEAVQL